MQLFSPDLLRQLLLGFAIGAVGVAAVSGDGTAMPPVLQAQAQAESQNRVEPRAPSKLPAEEQFAAWTNKAYPARSSLQPAIPASNKAEGLIP